ncbi:MAG: hypothetical protein EOP85_06185, partial [Verrucomicrobiaceae bacterium]
MKTQDIKRDVTSRHLRTGASSPGSKRADLCPESMMSGRGHRRRRRSREAGKPRSTLALMIVGATAFVVIAATFVSWLVLRLDRDTERTGSSIAEERDIRVGSEFPSPSMETTLDIVKRALAVRDVVGVDDLFRTGESSPEEIIDFLEDASLRDGGIEHYEWLSSLDKDGLLIEGVTVRYKGKEKPVNRLALLTPDESGKWKVDFEAFARLVEPGWRELLETEDSQALVRVSVAPGVYYNGAFSDDRKWVCYGITSPDLDETLQGYCRAGSPEAEAMARLFNHGEKTSRATLRMRLVNG